MNEDETRKQVEEDKQDDLELQDEDAEDVAGGSLSYGKVSIDYKEQKPDGTLGS